MQPSGVMAVNMIIVINVSLAEAASRARTLRARPAGSKSAPMIS